MLTVKSMEFAYFSLGLLGIIASLLVLGGPSPGHGVLPAVPSAQTCLQWLVTPPKMEDFPSNANWTCLQLGPPSDMTCPQENSSFTNCLQWVLSLDGGFSDAVNKALGFPDMVLVTSVIHVLANVGLLYGIFQSNSCFLAVFILYYYIVTFILPFIFVTLAVWNVIPSCESLLVIMCLLPMESSVILLYGKSWVLPVFVLLIRFVLFLSTLLLDVLLSFFEAMEKIDGVKKKTTPASEIKIQGDLVIQV